MAPDKEATNPNIARGRTTPRGTKRVAPTLSPLKQPEQKLRKPAKKDRRRVSFAPDPELTNVFHFTADDFTGDSGGNGFQPLQAAGGLSGCQPGLLNMTVPECHTLEQSTQAQGAVTADSPGQVSMELTLPMQASIQQPLHAQVQNDAMGTQHWRRRMPGEVTAALPSLGALAEADQLEDELLMQEEMQQVQQGAGNARGAWDGLIEPTLNFTAGITAALPGLKDLVAEDEDASAGMDLTKPTGRVLQHQLQLMQLAAAPATNATEPGAQMEQGNSGAAIRKSGAMDEFEAGQKVASMVNKWGFAPGREDTLDINLEMHGRMIMGDNTYARTYGENVTGDSHYEQADDGDTADSLVQREQQGTVGPHPQADAPPPESEEGQLLPAALAAPTVQPDWTAPAFLPPYLQTAPSTHSDHPALAQSPNASNSSLNTLGTRRMSVDVRRASLDPRSTRRLSVGAMLQDATGRLLADMEEQDLSPLNLDVEALATSANKPAPQAHQQSSDRHNRRRRSSGISLLGKGDLTLNLLDDEDDLLAGTGGEGEDVLAGLHKQIRHISQGSPGLHPLLGQVLEVEQQQAAQLELAGKQIGTAHPVPDPPSDQPLHQRAQAARTPRTTASLGYADSHNPATMAILRSGGTTRLLRDSVHAQQDAGAGRAPMGLQLELGGGSGDAAPTGRTNGTTKLLADMTMASSIGVKLLRATGSGAAGASPVGHGLTEFSLEEFERPPELPAGQQHQQHQLHKANEVPAAAAQLAAGAAGQQADFLSPQRSPVVQRTTGYPVESAADEQGAIPGGPKLARTPVSVSARPVSLPPRSAHGTPASHGQPMARSVSRQHSPSGGLRQAETPGSVHVHVPAASYPLDVDGTADQIPGGPKLARTPLGHTPATSHRGHMDAPGSAVAQHYPGSALAQAAAPSSVQQARYPGSAVAMHRVGMQRHTPVASLPPMTFQDFAKLTEVQFLDNLRRGTSINYADLQPNPVPQSLAESYRLLCITSPAVAELENGIRTLQAEVAARRVAAADAEAMVGQMNPPVFRDAQNVEGEQLEALKTSVGLLKHVCRQKAVALLKDVRVQMEESRCGRLRRNEEALGADLAFAQENARHLADVATAVRKYVSEQRKRMAVEAAERADEVERRHAVAGMCAELAAVQAANEARQRQLAEAEAHVLELAGQATEVSLEKQALQAQADGLQVTLQQSQQQRAIENDATPQAVLQNLEQLDVLRSCIGWQLEGAAEDAVNGEVCLRVADLFRIRITLNRTGVDASVQLLPASEAVSLGEMQIPDDRRVLAGTLAGCASGERRFAFVGEPGSRLPAVVQATAGRLGCIAGLVGELEGLRLALPALAEVVCTEQCVRLLVINLEAELRFSVDLQPGPCYPVGPLPYTARIWFDGQGQVNERAIAQAVASVPEGPGRLRRVAAALAALARSAAPRPAVAADAAFHTSWANPLFGQEQRQSEVTATTA